MPWFDGTNIRRLYSRLPKVLRTTKPVPPHGSHSILTPGAASPQRKQVAIHTTPQVAIFTTPMKQATKSSQVLSQEDHVCVPSISVLSVSSQW